MNFVLLSNWKGLALFPEKRIGGKRPRPEIATCKEADRQLISSLYASSHCPCIVGIPWYRGIVAPGPILIGSILVAAWRDMMEENGSYIPDTRPWHKSWIVVARRSTEDGNIVRCWCEKPVTKKLLPFMWEACKKVRRSLSGDTMLWKSCKKAVERRSICYMHSFLGSFSLSNYLSYYRPHKVHKYFLLIF